MAGPLRCQTCRVNPETRLLLARLRKDWADAAPVTKRALFALLVGCLPVLFSGTLTEAVEPVMLRTWFLLRGTREVPTSVTIVRMDKEAYDQVGRLPGERFPRGELADAIQKITSAGARAIVLDMILEQAGDRDEDLRLAEALANSPSVIGRFTQTTVDVDPTGRQRRVRRVVKPLSLFAEAAQLVVPLEIRLTNGRSQEISLSNEREIFSDLPVPMLTVLRKLYRPDLQAPGGFDFINFYGPPNTLTSVSLAELTAPATDVSDSYFRGRLVFIGAVSEIGVGVEAGKDTFLTSVSHLPMYGVEIHATIAANLIDGSWIRRLSVQAETLAMGLFAFFMAYVVLAAGPIAAVLWTISLAAAWLAFSYVAFVWLFTFVPALTVLLLVTPIVVACRWLTLLKRSARTNG